MITAALAAVAALGWGAADYLGGKASRGGSATLVVLVSQLVSLPVLVVLLVMTTSGPPQPADLAWGAATGCCGFAGMILLYRLLAAEGATIAAPGVGPSRRDVRGRGRGTAACPAGGRQRPVPGRPPGRPRRV